MRRAADLLHCINLQVEGKTRQMRKTARQYLLLTYVCDLAKSMPGRDARDVWVGLFQPLDAAEPADGWVCASGERLRLGQGLEFG